VFVKICVFMFVTLLFIFFFKFPKGVEMEIRCI